MASTERKNHTLMQLLTLDPELIKASIGHHPNAPATAQDSELVADRHFLDDAWENALDTYHAIPRKSWRVKEKMAYCFYSLAKWKEAAKIFSAGPSEQNPGSICIHILCLAEGGGYLKDEHREKVKRLLEAALVIPERAPPYVFYLLHRYYGWTDDDVAKKHAWLTKGIEIYPEAENVLLPYVHLALRNDLVEPHNLVNHLVPLMTDTWRAELLWLGFRAAIRAQQGENATRFLEILLKKGDETECRWLKLAAAEGFLTLEDWDAADRYFYEAGKDGPEYRTHARAERCIWDLVTLSARGRLAVSLFRKDRASAEERITAFSEAIKNDVNEWREPYGTVIENSGLPFWLGEEMLDYESTIDMEHLRELAIQEAPDTETKGFLRYLWTLSNRDEEGNYTESALGELRQAAAEAQTPMIQEALFEAESQFGYWRNAGKALTLFEIYLLTEAAHQNLLSNHSDPLEDQKAATVQDFSSGFRDALQASGKNDASHAYALYRKLLRPHLIEHALYDEFLVVQDAIREATGVEQHFEYGLAYDFLEQYDLAKDHYWSCGDETNVAALRNLARIARIEKSAVDLHAIAEKIDEILATVDGTPHDELRELLEKVQLDKARLDKDPNELKRLLVLKEIDRYSDEPSVFSISELSFDQSLHLLSLYRLCGDLQQDLTLEPYGDSETPLAPSSYDLQVIFQLMRLGLIHISDASSLNAFNVNSENEVSYYFNKIRWKITPTTLNIIGALEHAIESGEWPSRWHAEAADAMQRLALAECLEYLSFCADSRGMQAPQGEKTRLMFLSLMREFSVGQLYGLIWRSAANAADYYVRSGVSKNQAANSIITRIQGLADRGKAENWEVKPFSRERSCPRSQLNYVLYDAFLKVGERGFRDCIANIELPSVNLER